MPKQMRAYRLKSMPARPVMLALGSAQGSPWAATGVVAREGTSSGSGVGVGEAEALEGIALCGV